jgi:diguanylate cyclase (GGDEF)-like protein/PAS domain S-box-containing protein
MTITLPRSKGPVTGSKVFRVGSLCVYGIMLVQTALMMQARQITVAWAGITLLILLGLLLVVAVTRFARNNAAMYGQVRILFELLSAGIVIALLMLQPALPFRSFTWLIAMAALFPLVLAHGVALGAVAIIALTEYVIGSIAGTQPGIWLPAIFTTLLVGLLAIFLSRALNMNRTALCQAGLNERRFDAIARATRHVLVIADASYKVKYVNPALQEVLGYTPEETTKGEVHPVLHPAEIEEHQEKLRFLRDTPNSSIFSRHRTRHKNGDWVWLETRGYNMLHDSAIDGLVFSIEDITARTEAESKAKDEHALLRTVLDLNPSMIYAKDNDGRFTISNLSFQRRFGYASEEEMRGKTSHEVFLNRAREGQERDTHDKANALHLQDMQVLETGMPLVGMEMQGFWETDVERWYRTNKYPLLDGNGEISGVLGITRDITDRKEYELRLEHQALHDALTGLPNRRYLLQTIADAISKSSGKLVKLAVLFCDLDFFKNVNDTHGHDIGDKCLLELTRRIQAELPTLDFVARFGGDEFVILSSATVLEASGKAAALLKALSHPLVIDDVVVKIQASIGIATLRSSHKTPSDLIRDADAAMYQAKERGRNRADIFDATLQSSTTKRAQMDVALRFALERDELVLAYQPKVSMLDGSVKGFELLLRWNSPQYGAISPNEFIPIAEASGLVVPIGLWVLEKACKQLSAWQEKYDGLEGLVIAVNVSMRQLLQSSFLADVTGILKSTRVAPHSIELEITETSAMANPLQTIETLSKLKALGLRLALDDFGTGYSSLAYLQKLPIDVLKVDRAFVFGLGKNQSDREIVRLILALAKTLNLETIAEGVETRQHVDELTKMGCHLGQGFFFSPAISAAEAEQLLDLSHNFLVT